MSPANERQVGGTHYALEYQHWDWVSDIDLPYVLGCATKYIVRWRGKNGLQDLEKSIHYLEKAEELDLFMHHYELFSTLTAKFAAQLPPAEAKIIDMVVTNNFAAAAAAVKMLITRERDEPANMP